MMTENNIVLATDTTKITNRVDILETYERVHHHVLTFLLADVNLAPNTKKAYLKDLDFFFMTVNKVLAGDNTVDSFLALPREQVVKLVMAFSALQQQQGLSEATINRRLASIKALVLMGKRLNCCNFDLSDIKSMKIQKYRDTTGVSQDVFKQVLALPDRTTTKGKRDYALLRLLWENALRRGEVAKLLWDDLDIQGKRLRIYGKGRGNQPEWVSVSSPLINALLDWREVSPNDEGHIFLNFDVTNYGKPLQANGIYLIVRNYFEQLGINKIMSPHRIRHSAITAVLDASDGNVRDVQKFSRHKNIDTLLIYDDNRVNAQAKITNLASSLLD